MKSSNNEENDHIRNSNNHAHPRSDSHHRVHVRAYACITANRGAVDIRPDSFGAHESSANRRADCSSHKSSANDGTVDGGS